MLQRILFFVSLFLFFLLLIFSFSSYDVEQPHVTGLFTGEFAVTIVYPFTDSYRDSRMYWNRSLSLVSGKAYTVMEGGGNFTYTFYSDNLISGFFNSSFETENPSRITHQDKTALDKYVVVETNFSFANVTLAWTYNSSDVAGFDESSLRFYTFNNVTLQWDSVSTSVDTSARVLTASLTNFSTYGVFGSLSSPRVVAGGVSDGGGGGGSGGGGDVEVPLPVPLPSEIKKVVRVPLPGEETTLFDISVTIPPKYKALSPGDDLLAEIHLLQSRGAAIADVFVDYYIRDVQDILIFQESETKALEREITFLKEIPLPQDMPLGTYSLIVVVRYDSGLLLASAQTDFTVVARKINPLLYYIFGSFSLFFVLLYAFLKLRPFYKKLLVRLAVSKMVRRGKIL